MAEPTIGPQFAAAVLEAMTVDSRSADSRVVDHAVGILMAASTNMPLVAVYPSTEGMRQFILRRADDETVRVTTTPIAGMTMRVLVEAMLSDDDGEHQGRAIGDYPDIGPAVVEAIDFAVAARAEAV